MRIAVICAKLWQKMNEDEKNMVENMPTKCAEIKQKANTKIRIVMENDNNNNNYSFNEMQRYVCNNRALHPSIKCRALSIENVSRFDCLRSTSNFPVGVGMETIK